MSDSPQLNAGVEAALVLPVPEAEPWVGELRAEHDPAAALGVPAHITINYPFVPGVDADPQLLTQLSSLFLEVGSFHFELTRISQFPNVIYLAPEPDQPLVAMIERVANCFPESPPYGGQFETTIPHLTVAQSDDPEVLKEVGQQLEPTLTRVLPLSATAVSVWLIDNRAGRWQRRREFALAKPGR